MRMEWPSTLADDDAAIAREETTDGVRFVVHSRRGPQFACRTYAEAETRAFAYAEHARAHVWYTDKRGFQLVGGDDRPVLSSTHHPVGVTPTPNQAVHRREEPGQTDG